MFFKKEPASHHERLAGTYLQQAKSDFKSARSAERKQRLDRGALLYVQAAMNALSAACVLHGRFQNPSYSLSELLTIAGGFEAGLSGLKDVCLEMDDIQDKTFFELHKRRSNRIEKSHVERYGKCAEEILRRCERTLEKSVG